MHHSLQRPEGVAPEDCIFREINVEMDGYLVDILTGTGILLPHMLQIGTCDQDQVIVADYLIGITHNATHAWGMLHEVQFIHLMVMDGVSKLLLASFCNIEHILTRQLGDLVYDFRLNHYLQSFIHYSLNLEFLQDFRHALHILDAHRHKGQAQYILDESHLRKHRLHTGGIAVDE